MGCLEDSSYSASCCKRVAVFSGTVEGQKIGGGLYVHSFLFGKSLGCEIVLGLVVYVLI